MTRSLPVAAAAFLALSPIAMSRAQSPATRPAADSATQLAVAVAADSAAIRAIVAEGMTRSHVAADLMYLTDVIGPRLTGSAGMRRANDWTARKFREYRMDSAWLEPWKFGPSWERGPMTLTLVSPHRRQLQGASWAWAPGTNGVLAGDVVYMDARTTAEFRQRFAGKLRGKWAMLGAPAPIWNPDGPAMTAADAARRDSIVRAVSAPPTDPAEQEFRQMRRALAAAEGIAGNIRDAAKEHALLNMSGSPAAVSTMPDIVVPHETYTQFYRLLQAGETVRIEADIRNTLGRDSVMQYNTIAEIRGSERSGEVVLLGAHLDSWDLGTGTSDNATGSIAVLEAARILRGAGVKPKRTIRFALFSGEEEGLYGSQMYADAHRGEMGNVQAVMVLDNGTGRVRGVALQGRDEMRDLWRALFAPIAELGPFVVRSGNKGGTDHLSFVPFGVPTFNFDQESRGYDHTHHSQSDTFDHAVLDDLRQAATVMAATAYGLANLPELLPRRTRRAASR
ncbi:MAG: M20/M25/M40 family metallo-hydrolase [Gemmatimonadaceae bacterium]